MRADDVDRVIKCELALLSPAVRRAPSRLAELLDPDFREIGASGRLWTRAEVMVALSKEPSADGEAAIEASEIAADVVGTDLILITYVTDRAGQRARRSSLWRRSTGRWRVLHHQGTPLAGP